MIKKNKGIVLGFITDTHFRFNNPEYRKGNFKEDIINKLNEVKSLIRTYEVDALLHGGDMFDTAFVSEQTWVYFASQFSEMNIPIYALAGNHDMEGHNEISLPNSPIDFIRQLNIINLIVNNKDNPVVIKKNGVSVQITGRSYHTLMDQKLKQEDYVVTNKQADYAIHMVHGNLLDKPIIQLANFTLIDEIKDTVADLTLAGHYHMGFPLTTIDDNGFTKYFYNPGGFVRKTKKEMLRTPVFTIIFINENGIEIKDIPLKSAKKTEDVLNIERIEKEESNKRELNELVGDIKSKTEIKKVVNLNDMINNIGTQKNIPDAVKKMSLEYIKQAKDELRGGKR